MMFLLYFVIKPCTCVVSVLFVESFLLQLELKASINYVRPHDFHRKSSKKVTFRLISLEKLCYRGTLNTGFCRKITVGTLGN